MPHRSVVIGFFLTDVRAHELFEVCEESEHEQPDRKLDDVACGDYSSDARLVHDQPVWAVGNGGKEAEKGFTAGDEHRLSQRRGNRCCAHVSPVALHVLDDPDNGAVVSNGNVVEVEAPCPAAYVSDAFVWFACFQFEDGDVSNPQAVLKPTHRVQIGLAQHGAQLMRGEGPMLAPEAAPAARATERGRRLSRVSASATRRRARVATKGRVVLPTVRRLLGARTSARPRSAPDGGTQVGRVTDCRLVRTTLLVRPSAARHSGSWADHDDTTSIGVAPSERPSATAPDVRQTDSQLHLGPSRKRPRHRRPRPRPRARIPGRARARAGRPRRPPRRSSPTTSTRPSSTAPSR